MRINFAARIREEHEPKCFVRHCGVILCLLFLWIFLVSVLQRGQGVVLGLLNS